MKGQLREHPLAELIHEISDARFAGALRLAHERVKGVVYFEAGRPVAALTNLRAYRLAEMLRRADAVPPASLDEIVKEGMSDEQAAAALSQAGALGGAELRRWQGRQSTEVLRALLGWAEGEWSFEPRVRLEAVRHAQLSAPQLLLESARALPDEEAARRLSDPEDLLSPSGDANAEGIRLLPTEGFVLSRVSGPTRLGELLAVSGLPEAETLRAAYGLALGGLLVRERWPRALSAEESRHAPARREDAAPTRPEAEASTRADAEAHAQTAAKAEEPPTPATEPQAEEDPRAAIEELFERSRAATHYEVLGVVRSAKPEEVKRVYYALARRLHPDRFRRDADGPIKQQIDAAFARIAQAYDVLKDSRLRAAYDLKLPPPGAETRPLRVGESAGVKSEQSSQGGARVAAPASPALSKESAQLARADEKFQEGLAALQQNKLPLARRCLGEAALLAPRQARYRAFYGRALAGDKNSRRQAESELQTAITLDERNAQYRVMLAELYHEHGLRRRAEGELERALKLDPTHAAARRLLEQLRGRK